MAVRSLHWIENIKPILKVRDMELSRDFYVRILGFRETDWGNNAFTGMHRDKTGIYLCTGAQGNPGTWVWIGFEGDIFKLHAELLAKGVAVRQEPSNFSWALEMQVEDPDGHVLRFGTEPDNSRPFLDRERSNSFLLK